MAGIKFAQLLIRFSEERFQVNVEKFKILEDIRHQNPDGRLLPADVVKAAEDPESPLHSDFEWDDSEAARKFREQEARTLIRAFITFEPRIQRNSRAYVSVPTDRTNGGGYRATGDVLANPDYVAQLTEEVRIRLRGLRTTYQHLKALDPLWTLIEGAAEEFLAKRQSEAA